MLLSVHNEVKQLISRLSEHLNETVDMKEEFIFLSVKVQSSIVFKYIQMVI